MELKLVNILKDEDTFSAFKGVLPEGTDYRKCLLLGAANDNNQALGAMVVDMEADVYTINWLYVATEMRKNGVGNFLLDGFIDFMKESMNFKELEIYYSENSGDIKAFFEAREDFFIMEDCKEYTISREEFAESKAVHKLLKISSDAVNWKEINATLKNDFFVKMEAEGFYNVIDRKAFEDSLDKDLCFCMTNDSKITGCILMRKLTDSDLEITFLYSEDEYKVPDLLAPAINEIVKKYKNFILHITAASEFAEKAVNAYWGKEAESTVRYVATLE